MSSGTNCKIIKAAEAANAYILYDASIIAEPSLQLFDRDYHTKQQAQQNNSSVQKSGGVGRAKVVYFCSENRSFVLKHYFRGGMVALFLKDQYWGRDIEKSRAFREWRLLKKMFQLGLPVPQAVAAHVQKSLFFYRADLITEEIKNVKTLADILAEKNIDYAQWKKVGACIKLFHNHNIFHADLNARNILITEDQKIYLIDFDNSDFRVDSTMWKMDNLERLKRSLYKFKKNQPHFNFDEQNWLDLLGGYGETLLG